MKLNSGTGRQNRTQKPQAKRAVHILNPGLLVSFVLLGQVQAATKPAGQATMSMSQMPKSQMNASMVIRLRGLGGQAFDLAWSKAMLDHHAAAVAMARTEVQKGHTERVKKAATAVLADQTREITLMQGWLKQWKQPAYTPVVKLTAQVPGISTDRWFLTEMIPHHQGAVAMSQLTPGRSQNAAVKSLSIQITAAQTREIRQYQGWLKTVR